MTKTLEQWSATLQKVPQMSDAIADVVKYFKLKLPDRRYLFMYESPQMENFREMGALDDVAKNSRTIESCTKRSSSRRERGEQAITFQS